MSKLYKGRYLIAVYDQFDRFVDCSTTVIGLKCFSPSSAYSQISRKEFFSMRKYKIVLIDCLEKHNDVFAEEDEIFLQEENIVKKIDVYLALADKYHKSLRTIQRWVSSGKINVEQELKGV